MMSIDGESTEDIFSQLCNDNGVSYLAPSPQESEDAARIRREQLKELVTRFVQSDLIHVSPAYILIHVPPVRTTYAHFVNSLFEEIL